MAGDGAHRNPISLAAVQPHSSLVCGPVQAAAAFRLMFQSAPERRSGSFAGALLRASVLVALALLLLTASASMQPFLFEGIDGHLLTAVAYGDTDAYWQAWQEALTFKFLLQDYGVTLLILGVLVGIFGKWRPRAPATRMGFIFVASLAPVATAGGVLFDLIQAKSRREIPPWFEWLEASLLGVSVVLVVGLACAFVHFTLLAGIGAQRNACISIGSARCSGPWLGLSCSLALLFSLAYIAHGVYWYAVPGLLWLYFFASIAAVRHASSVESAS